MALRDYPSKNTRSPKLKNEYICRITILALLVPEVPCIANLAIQVNMWDAILTIPRLYRLIDSGVLRTRWRVADGMDAGIAILQDSWNGRFRGTIDLVQASLSGRLRFSLTHSLGLLLWNRRDAKGREDLVAW